MKCLNCGVRLADNEVDDTVCFQCRWELSSVGTPEEDDYDWWDDDDDDDDDARWDLGWG